MYIVIEGMGGTGKGTQSAILKERLAEKYPKKTVHLVREPGTTPISEAIRTLVQGTPFDETMTPATNVYLYAAARAQLIHGVIKPALENGDIVVSDRSVLSSIAIQGNGLNYGMQAVLDVNTHALAGINPDYIFFLDAPLEVGMQRVDDVAGDKRESEPTEFQQACYDGYRKAKSMPEFSPVRHDIDATGTIDEVTGRILTVLS